MKSMSQLKYHFGAKMRAYPNYNQLSMTKLNSDNSRFFYNHLIAIDKLLYSIRMVYGRNRFYDYNPLINRWYLGIKSERKFTVTKKIYHFLKDNWLDSLAIANSKQNYKTAWKNYDDGLQGIPTFHSKSKHPYVWKYQTNCIYHKNKNGKYIGSVRILDRKHIKLPKLGRIRLATNIRKIIWNHRNDMRIGTVTVTRDNCNNFYISLQLASDTRFVKPFSKTNRRLGYDINISNFFYASNGTVVGNPRFYTKALPRLAKIMQRVSRRYRRAKKEHRNPKNSKGYQRARRRLAQWLKKVYDKRHNFLEFWSTALIKNQDLVVGEDLRSKNMLRNHRLAQKISDVGARSFIAMLQQKAEMYNKNFVLIDPYDTTQRCHNCGYICNYKDKTHIKLGVEKWQCPVCKHWNIRDYNASLNIIDKGIIKIEAYDLASCLALILMATRARSSSKIWFSLIGLLHVITVPDISDILIPLKYRTELSKTHV